MIVMCFFFFSSFSYHDFLLSFPFASFRACLPLFLLIYFLSSFYLLARAGPGMSGKLRALLTKFTKESTPEPRAERLSWIRRSTERKATATSPSKRLSKRRARQQKVHLLKSTYGGQQ